MSSFMKRELRGLSEPLSASRAAERLQTSMQVPMFFQVLVAGVQSATHVTLKALNTEVRDFHMSFEIEL